MIIIPLPYNKKELEKLSFASDAFDLIVKEHVDQHYLAIENNTLMFIGQGIIPGKFACQIISRTSTMNGTQGIPQNQGNVGFLGKYSGTDDAVRKLLPKDGYCISNMRFMKYHGQKLKGKKDHYGVIKPIICLFQSNPSETLEHFLHALGWGNRIKFTCFGNWKYDMSLFIGDDMAPNLETWFTRFCSIALG